MADETETRDSSPFAAASARVNGDDVAIREPDVSGHPGDMERVSTAREKTNSVVKVLSLIVGVLLAMCISLAVRLESGYPPGVEPIAFGHLLGMPAPSFDIVVLDGRTVSLEGIREELAAQRGAEWLLFFTNSNCKACDAAYASLKKASERLPVVVIGMGKRRDLAAKIGQHQIQARVGYDSLAAVGRLYDIQLYPSAFLVDEEGIVLTAATGVRCVDMIVGERSLRQEDRT